MNYSQKIIESAFLNKPYEIKKLVKEAMAEKIGLVLEEQLKQLASGLMESAPGVQKETDDTPETDPVGEEDRDVNNDGEEDEQDKYLMARRRAIAKNKK